MARRTSAASPATTGKPTRADSAVHDRRTPPPRARCGAAVRLGQRPARQPRARAASCPHGRAQTTRSPGGNARMTETLTTPRPGKLIIDGKAVDAASGRTFTTMNPATEQPICDVAEAGPEDVDRAVAAARAAFEPWSRMRPAERQRVLFRLGDLIEQHADEIARLETLDNGKPIFESRQIDIPMVVNCFHYFSGWATKLAGETLPVSPAFFTYTLREPLGVVG